MKPCSKQRKLIAWLAVRALDARQECNLRAHLNVCAGCRDYYQQVCDTAKNLAASDINAEIDPAPDFHHRVLNALRAEETTPAWEIFVERMTDRFLRWRVALPATGAMAVLLALLFLLGRDRNVSRPVTEAPHAFPPANLRADLPPTFANYQMIANQSLDTLDELLLRQGISNPSGSLSESTWTHARGADAE